MMSGVTLLAWPFAGSNRSFDPEMEISTCVRKGLTEKTGLGQFPAG